MLTFVFLTVQNKDVKKTTANLLAPIIINQNNHEAKQLILENTNYMTKHQLINNVAEDDK